MSVPEYERSIGLLRVITAAYANCKHTIKVCKSEKNFPKRDRWILTNNIVNEAESILQCCLMANNINVRCKEDFWDRRRLQMKAKGHAMNQLALMRLAFETLSLDLSEEYWISLVDDVLRCDIYHYFPETRHDVAKVAIRKRVNDDRAYAETERIIDSFDGDRGIALGSQVSQIMQLAVLDDLDHFIKERMRIRHYIRYMDDFVLIHHDREILEDCLRNIRSQLDEIGLRLNDKTHIHPLRNGIQFLQWRFILTDSGKVIRRIGRRNVTREQRKLKKLANKIKNGELPSQKLYENFQSWRGHIRRGNTWQVEKRMEALYNQLQEEVDKYDGEQGIGISQRETASDCCRS